MDITNPVKNLSPRPGGFGVGVESKPAPAACPRCGNPMDGNNCPHCNPLVDANDTMSVQMNTPELAKLRAALIGKVDIEEQKPITLEIQGKHLKVPVVDCVTLGRVVQASPVQPDIDLSSFEGDIKSVSRRHVEIRRRNTVIYIADLGSANGTWLNGHRLLPNAERPLRNGDELQLGQLTVKVKYWTYAR